MKRSAFLSIIMLTGMFASANIGNGDTNNSEPKQVNNQTIAQVSTSEEDDDAIWCEVRDKDGNVIVSCVLCNCKESTKTVLESGKENSKSNDVN